MSKNIFGKNFVLYIEKDGENTAVCCGQELSIELTTEAVEVSKAPYSNWRSFMYGMHSFSVSASQLVTVGDGIKASDIIQHIIDRGEVEFVATVKGHDEIFFAGNLIFPQFRLAGNNGELMSYSFTAQGTGELKLINPYEFTILVDGDGVPLVDGDGAVIIEQESGDLNPINLDVNC